MDLQWMEVLSPRVHTRRWMKLAIKLLQKSILPVYADM